MTAVGRAHSSGVSPGEGGTAGRRLSPLRRPLRKALLSLLLFLLILHYSLEKPTPAFIGHLRGSKTSSSLGIKESSCYLYLKRNGLIGMSPLPGQLLIPSTHIRHMVRQKSLIGYVFLGKLLNPCASVSSSNTLTVALWSENPEPEHPAKPHQIPDPQKW